MHQWPTGETSATQIWKPRPGELPPSAWMTHTWITRPVWNPRNGESLTGWVLRIKSLPPSSLGAFWRATSATAATGHWRQFPYTGWRQLPQERSMAWSVRLANHPLNDAFVFACMYGALAR